MVTVGHVSRVSPAWLRLREPADATARSAELAVLRQLSDPALIWDLGCGTGSMFRWLAPRIPVRQHWIFCDRDGELLRQARIDATIDGLTIQTRQCDATLLTASDLRGASLVTCSALLDLLTVEEIERIATACVGAGCPALLTITVTGQVRLSPPHPLDTEFEAAFNAHQRRVTGGRRLLGPDAVVAAADAFTRRGARVTMRPSPWCLDAGSPELLAQWFAGWVAAACEQRADLTPAADAYTAQRLESLAAQQLSAVVQHADLLAIPATAMQ